MTATVTLLLLQHPLRGATAVDRPTVAAWQALRLALPLAYNGMRTHLRRQRPDSGMDLLLCALASPGPPTDLQSRLDRASAAALRSMVEMAREHRVLGTLGERLGSIDANLPGGLRDQLAQARRLGMARHLVAGRTLGAVDDLLDVPFLVLKGPALAITYHDDPSARMYSDLDLLVDRRDFTAAVGVLTEAGFEPLATNWSGFVRHTVAEVPLGRSAGMLDLDLHFHPVGLGRDRRSLALDVGRIMDRAVEVDVGGVTVRTTDPADTLIHLCVNAGLDGARRLKGLLDIDVVLRSGSVDHAAFLDRCRSAGAHLLAAAVLQRCAMTLGTAMAGELASALQPPAGWLTANDLLDRSRRSHGPGRGVAPGWLLSAGRPSLTDTAAVIRHNVADAAGRARGRPGLAGPLGELDWLGGDGAGIDTYLQWVDSAVPVRVDQPADPAVVAALLRHVQPRATRLMAAAQRPDGARGRTSIWLVRDDDGRLLAVAVASHWAIGKTPAFVVMLDSRAAATVSGLFDRDGVTRISAFEQDLRPLRDVGSRWGAEMSSTVAALEPGFAWEPPTAPTRLATEEDLDDLVRLRQISSGGALPGAAQVRQVQRVLIEDLTFVLDDEDGRPLGCISRQAWTTEWDIWGHMDVLPQHRGRGNSWRLLAAGVDYTRRRGAGGMTFVAATNPMPLPADAVLSEPWVTVQLRPPRRFRGEPRLHRALHRVQGRLQGRAARHAPQILRTAENAESLITQRRTQQALRADTDNEEPPAE